MHNFGVRLQYSFEPEHQRGARLDHPLFELLTAIRTYGSIKQAAEQLDVSYRHAWGSLKWWEQVLGQPLIVWEKGRSAQLTPFGEKLAWAEERARIRLTPQIEALRAELQNALSVAFDDQHQVLTVFASHDLALPLLRELAGDLFQLHIDLRFAGSVDCLHALAAGRCLVAGFHVPDDANAHSFFAKTLKPLLRPGKHKLLGFARRTQGLMVARGNPLRLASLQDSLAPHVRFVQRQPGSGTRLLFEHLARQANIAVNSTATTVRTEDTHVAVAAAIASGSADAGLGIEAAARERGLDFVPLAQERYFLVCLRDALEHPAVIRLRDALASKDWLEGLRRLNGYEPLNPGEVLALTKALQWWNYRTQRRPGIRL
jgi:putative molybdopterin biosynthesis protein